jgi:hypothetical protein
MPGRTLPALCGALLSVLGAAAPAQVAQPEGETDDFAQAMESVLAEAGEARPLLRCTALYRAFRLYAGADSEIGATAAERETDLATTAAVIWQDETGTRDLSRAFEAIVPMMAEATELFLARMVDNAGPEGNVLDPALEADLAYCDALHDGITRGG